MLTAILAKSCVHVHNALKKPGDGLAGHGWQGLLRNLTSTQPELGPDITSLTVTADTTHTDIAHITITDLHDERWHVPPSLFPEASAGT